MQIVIKSVNSKFDLKATSASKKTPGFLALGLTIIKFVVKGIGHNKNLLTAIYPLPSDFILFMTMLLSIVPSPLDEKCRDRQ